MLEGKYEKWEFQKVLSSLHVKQEKNVEKREPREIENKKKAKRKRDEYKDHRK